MPGTALVMGVRNPAGGDITPRSICGVKAPAGNPARELLAGVVAGLFVVRSALSKQVASAILVLRRASNRSHCVAAEAALPDAKVVRVTTAPHRIAAEQYIQISPIPFIRRRGEANGGSAKL